MVLVSSEITTKITPISTTSGRLRASSVMRCQLRAIEDRQEEHAAAVAYHRDGAGEPAERPVRGHDVELLRQDAEVRRGAVHAARDQRVGLRRAPELVERAREAQVDEDPLVELVRARAATPLVAAACQMEALEVRERAAPEVALRIGE